MTIAAVASLSVVRLSSSTRNPAYSSFITATPRNFRFPKDSRSLSLVRVSSTHKIRLSPYIVRCSATQDGELKSTIDKVVNSEKVVLFMKGNKDFPQCGFSNTVVQILKSLNVPFQTFDILENNVLRQGLKEYSSWPTFPQLYIDGEFFGGCDITLGYILNLFSLFIYSIYPYDNNSQ